jgi:hypothetical protein
MVDTRESRCYTEGSAERFGATKVLQKVFHKKNVGLPSQRKGNWQMLPRPR